MPNIEDIELRSEEVQEILTRTPRWMIRWGSALFLILILLLLAITWFVKYPDVIITESLLTTKIPPEQEFASISAKLDTILIKDSQLVDSNAILAVLENTANTKDVLYLKSILDTIKINSNSLKFPFEELPILFLGDIDNSFVEFENSYSEYILNNKLQPFLTTALANKVSIQELRRRLQNLNSQYLISESEREFKRSDTKRHKILFEKGVISKQEFENKQLELLSSERNFRNLGISISQVREAISDANTNASSTDITRTLEETRMLKKVLQSFNQLKIALQNWENTYALKSSIKGNVSFFKYWNKNQTVTQGDLVFTIIPHQNSEFLVKVKAPSQNSGKIKIGQKVNIKLENYPHTEFGVLTGEVNTISLISDEEGMYLIDVSIPNKLITSYNREIEFKQEMRGSAEIITEDLRLIERFFYQIKDIFKR